MRHYFTNAGRFYRRSRFFTFWDSLIRELFPSRPHGVWAR